MTSTVRFHDTVDAHRALGSSYRCGFPRAGWHGEWGLGKLSTETRPHSSSYNNIMCQRTRQRWPLLINVVSGNWLAMPMPRLKMTMRSCKAEESKELVSTRATAMAHRLSRASTNAEFFGPSTCLPLPCKRAFRVPSSIHRIVQVRASQLSGSRPKVQLQDTLVLTQRVHQASIAPLFACR